MNEIQIRKFFEVIKDNEKLTEVRIIGERGKTFSGYFSDVDTLINAIKPYDKYNIYFTLNTIQAACASRTQNNIIVQSPKSTTSDIDIHYREWILIDFDPKRPSDTNATEEEKETTQKVVNKVYSYLRSQGFSSPIICDSSNGYHLLYKVLLNNTPKNTAIIKKFLNTLNLMFSTDEVEIDTSVFNASRICKLYGTTSRKGSNTKSRPQRESKILKIPDKIELTSISLFENIGKEMPEPEKPSYQNNYNTSFDLDEFIRKHNITITKEIPTSNGKKLLLEQCPFDSNHKSPDSALFVMNSGAIGFKCFHNSCQHRSWRDVRDLFEPREFKTKYDKYSNPPPIDINKEEDTSFIDTAPIVQHTTITPSAQMYLQLRDIEYPDRSNIISIKSGITELDKAIKGFNLGEVSLWSGNNASGKSSVLSQLMLYAINQSFKAVIYSGELNATRVKLWTQLQASGRQFNLQRPDGLYYTPKHIASKIDDWTYDKLWIYNNNFGHKFKTILKGMEEMTKVGVKCFVLDNLMALDILTYDGDKYDKQKSLILDIVNFAKKYNVHIHIVAHPRKSTGFLRKTDIAGTADLTNAVDNVFIVHRVNNDFNKNIADFYGNEAHSKYTFFGNVIEVCKNRDIGIMDYLVGLYYENQSKRFLNYPYESINFNWQEIVEETCLDFTDDGDLPV